MKLEKFKKYQVSNLKNIVGGGCATVYCSDDNGNSGTVDTDTESVADTGSVAICDQHFSWTATTANVMEY